MRLLHLCAVVKGRGSTIANSAQWNIPSFQRSELTLPGRAWGVEIHVQYFWSLQLFRNNAASQSASGDCIRPLYVTVPLNVLLGGCQQGNGGKFRPLILTQGNRGLFVKKLSALLFLSLSHWQALWQCLCGIVHVCLRYNSKWVVMVKLNVYL